MILSNTTATVRELSRVGMLICGAVLQGTAMAVFLFPHHVPSGGAAGLSLLFNHWFSMPLGWSIWLINFSMLALAFYFFGMNWTIRTMFSVTVTSITVNILSPSFSQPQNSVGFDLLIGGILFGLGVGLLIKHGASSGGMLIPALMMARYRHLTPGRAMFWINMSIFILTASVIQWEIVLYAIVCQWLSCRVIDLNNS